MASACGPYRELIEPYLEGGRNATAICQHFVDEHGFEASYDSVRRFVRKLRRVPCREAHPRFETEPGKEAQVDYGTGPTVGDLKGGKYRRTRLFVLAPGDR